MRALGLMSGTSMDGVDACLIETDGIAAGTPLDSRFRPYTRAERAVLAKAQGRWPEDGGLEEAADVVMSAHAQIARSFSGVDLVGFHGQTLAHDPAGRRTHQLGDGAALAKRLGVPVAWDFRTKDVAAGGQGAPLAPFYHHALVRTAGLLGHIALLTLGGVANVTAVDASQPDPAASGALLAFDTGPGNALLDDFMQARLGLPCDDGGAYAAKGTPDSEALAGVLRHPFFGAPPPKSLDRSAFSGVLSAIDGLSPEDGAATLTHLTAACVAAGAAHLPHPPERWLVCGGGRHNPAIMAALAERLGAPVAPVEAMGWDGDMLEAQAFGWLAVRSLKGLPISAPGTTGAPRPMQGGQLAHP